MMTYENFIWLTTTFKTLYHRYPVNVDYFEDRSRRRIEGGGGWGKTVPREYFN